MAYFITCCRSVNLLYCDKTAEAKFTQFSITEKQPGALHYCVLSLIAAFEGIHQTKFLA